MKPFSEEIRYGYDLTPDSWVVDAGAYMGNFSREITRRYDCHVLGFEPVFWHDAAGDQSEKTLIIPYALGAHNGWVSMGLANDSTGIFCDHEREDFRMLDVYYLDSLLHRIDLLKLNIEGMEYEVLERILEKDMHRTIDNIQVQFHHNVPDYNKRRVEIMNKLADTHVLTYCYPYIWENWRRK